VKTKTKSGTTRSGTARGLPDPQSSIKSLHDDIAGENGRQNNGYDMATLSDKDHDSQKTGQSSSDLERGQTMWIDTEVRVSDETQGEEELREHRGTSHTIGEAW